MPTDMFLVRIKTGRFVIWLTYLQPLAETLHTVSLNVVSPLKYQYIPTVNEVDSLNKGGIGNTISVFSSAAIYNIKVRPGVRRLSHKFLAAANGAM